MSNDKSIAGLHPEIIVIFSQYSAYPLQDRQSAIFLSFVAYSSLLPCGLQSTHPLMPCYISPYVVYNICAHTLKILSVRTVNSYKVIMLSF